MQTSCFSVAGNHPNAVAISLKTPRGYSGRFCFDLAPLPYMLRIKDEIEYTKYYRQKVLKRLHPLPIWNFLGDDAILLCWEPPGEFCHRRLVADWLAAFIGIPIPELVPPGGAQQNLFRSNIDVKV